MNQRHNPELTRRINLPDAATLISRLPDMADAIHQACIKLNREQSIESCDALTAVLKTADQIATHIRKALHHDQEAQRDFD